MSWTGVYRMCETQNALLVKTLSGYLNFSRQLVADSGGISLATEKVTWDAVNQYSQNRITVNLPKMLLGGSWPGKVFDAGTSVPMVDRIKNLAEDATCTVFQRMNDAGDMLRVVTSVVKTDGNRAIGTYIPRTNPDGKANPVVSKVLNGGTYSGRAFVVDRWYLTSYEPIYDSDKSIIGMRYVGIPQESVQSIRKSIYNLEIGQTGYAYVLDEKGYYVISEDGKRDGENISQSTDADGNLFIQAIVAKGLTLKPGEIAEHYYPWKNPGDPKARMKIIRFMYYEPWGWIISAGSYMDEFLEGVHRIEKRYPPQPDVSVWRRRRCRDCLRLAGNPACPEHLQPDRQHRRGR